MQTAMNDAHISVKNRIWTARAQGFLDFDRTNMTIRFAGFIGARNDFFQKLMSVM